MGRRVLVGVLLDGRRREGVDDRHRLAVAVEAAGDGCLGAVGALQLVGRVAARRVRQELLAVGGRDRRVALVVDGDLLAPRGRARRRVDEGRRRGRVGGVGPHEPVAAVQAGDARDAARDRARDAQVAVGRLQRLAAVLVGAQLRLERLLDLGRRAAGLDPAVVVGPVGADREARLLQVGADRGHVGVGRRVAGAELVGRQVLAVAGARRVGRRRDGGVERLGVAHAQVDPERVLGAVGNGPDLGVRRGPVRRAVGQSGAARARGRLRGRAPEPAGRRRRALPAVRWNGARDYLRQRMKGAAATPGSLPCDALRSGPIPTLRAPTICRCARAVRPRTPAMADSTNV